MFFFMTLPVRQFYGLPIHFETHASTVGEKSPWPETLSIYIDAKDRYYINGRLVPKEALRRELEQELGHRIVWSVYFDADRDALNGDAIYAMDTIRSLGATLIWLTPKVRQEMEQKANSHAAPTVAPN